MSVHPLTADIQRLPQHVRLVPLADSRGYGRACRMFGWWIGRNLNVARFIDPIASNLLQASAQTLAPVPPGELRQNP
jgi:hypothetical protein